MYGAETWNAAKEVETRFSVMETKMLRWTASGPSCTHAPNLTCQTVAPSLHLSLEITFLIASERHVISIKQRSWHRLLKISRNGIRDDNKE
ncbi:unnamed protein product [Heligmosomoides polygyrus]|uniref:Phlebovirus glycoprotein G2 fusion domain-containing protein n=1 Tax=Heligmosomoides polygyrus TaxID=6339 RepID=A0A183FUP5_HELPZ|nr:unnamed protein product [Heligmosomoides polygyrus]